MVITNYYRRYIVFIVSSSQCVFSISVHHVNVDFVVENGCLGLNKTILKVVATFSHVDTVSKRCDKLEK